MCEQIRIFISDIRNTYIDFFLSVYAVLRRELWGEAIDKFQRISYVHGRLTSAPAKVKI